MNGTSSYLFVYGSLRKEVDAPMAVLLSREAEFYAQGCLQAVLYDLGCYPGAVCSDNREDSVKGDIYLLRDAEALFAVLDAYEECTPDYAQPHEYKRLQQTVMTLQNEKLSAWVYLYNRPTTALRRIASGDYLQFLNGTDRLFFVDDA